LVSGYISNLVNRAGSGQEHLTYQPTNVPTYPFRRILLVRLRQIGDVVFTTPAVHALRRRFPSAHLTYIVEPAAAPVVTGNPHLDEVIVAPRRGGVRGLLDDLALGRRLRARDFDLAIDFHGGPRASLLTWLSRAPVRIGYQVAGRRWIYTRSVARPRELRPRHSVVNQWDLLATLDISPPDPSTSPMEMAADPAAAVAVAERLERAGVAEHDPLVIVHVSAGNPFRRWPAAHFVQLVTALANDDAARRIVVTSGPSEGDAAGRVVAEARARLDSEATSRIVSCGEFSLAELRALLDRAVLYVGGDSGPLHIAATTRVPIVGLYGPTLPERSAPWRSDRYVTESVDAGPLPCRPCDQRVCAPGDFRCLTSILPAQVLDAARRALARAESRGSDGWG
jgi:lipopolysaccharide heptosyltransferase II